MMLNQTGSERAAVLAVLAPASRAAGATSTAWIPLKNFARIQAAIMTGVLGTGATVAAKITVATDSAGTAPLDVPGAGITTLVKATGDNKVAVLDVDVGRIPHAAPYTHARLTVTVGVADSIVGAIVTGLDARYGSATQFNSAIVAEVVTV